MVYIMQILVLITCCVAMNIVYAYPAEQISSQSPRLSDESEVEIQLPLAEAALRNLYRYERTLNRLRRAVAELDYEEAAADDMELAEINVFRPLFRYRAEIARQVKNPQQKPQQFG
ncbi:uncharacterized protein LOC133840371 [Drosophila sulfurigaster albostrigata]|uniref:uncharacterized protein LOC133840371 n=1 Tax=Drosophila sulfurigaster albostrigata TaxID=89887 RepID=UPI002D218F49|nr:uncharacterized protein LOC133840371 [Drosophila sulfurigaster albostrigata]